MKICQVKDLEIGTGIVRTCVPITATDSKQIIKELTDLQNIECDLIELRLDYLADLEEIPDLFVAIENNNYSKPIILTLRSTQQGGKFEFKEEIVKNIYELGVKKGLFAIYDLELIWGKQFLSTLIAMIQSRGQKVLISDHNFTGIYDQEAVYSRLTAMDDLGGDILKVAMMPKERKDIGGFIDAVVNVQENFDKPLVLIAMGQLGMFSRVMAQQLNSAISFGTVRNQSAPGQLALEDLNTILRILGKYHA